MANFCSGVKVRLFGGAAGSMSSSVTSSFWARSIKGVELVKVMVSVLPVSPWREERLRQVSHVSLTDRAAAIRQAVLLRFRPSPAQDFTLDSPAPVTSMQGVVRPDEFGMRITWLVSSGAQRLEREVTGHTAFTDHRLSRPSTDPGRQADVIETRTSMDISVPDETLVGGIDEPRRRDVGRIGVLPGTDVPVFDLADVSRQVRAALLPRRHHRRCHHRGAERIDRPSGDTGDGQELRRGLADTQFGKGKDGRTPCLTDQPLPDANESRVPVEQEDVFLPTVSMEGIAGRTGERFDNQVVLRFGIEVGK